tara:strand:- start:1398 stop:2171 length:774 start_codon:yes stop_codon:yes gene_type:complete
MILSRIIHHLRTQNWTAVALEFVIVIAGVVIGFQVTAWNETREGEARGEAYLERIQSDLAVDIASYDDRIAFWSAVSDYGVQALETSNNPDRIADTEADWELIVAYFQASQVSEFNAVQTTYTEITSAGELGLIANLNVRERLSVYYTLTENFTMTERPAYRVTVRGIIPVRLQLYIWENCWDSDFYGRQFLIACDPPADGGEIMSTANLLATDTELHNELRYWISTLQVLQTMGRDRRGEASDIRAAIAADRGAEL